MGFILQLFMQQRGNRVYKKGSAMKNKYDMSIKLDDKNTVVVFDANAWLNLYYIPIIALQEIIHGINEHLEKFWIPNQVFNEYKRNQKIKKDAVVGLFKNAQSDSLKEINISKDRVLQKIETFKKQNHIWDNDLKDNIVGKYNELINLLKEGYQDLESKYGDDIKAIKDRDIVDELVEVLFSKTDRDFSIIEKMNICEEGEIRYKYKVAPGYTDAGKIGKGNDFTQPYGDLLIWKEMLRKVKGTAINMIFVQEERKKDWLEEKNGCTLARVLIEEYSDASKGKIEVYNFEAFLENYAYELGIQEPIIKELIKKLRLERAVYSYITAEADSIAQEVVEEYFEDYCVMDEVFNQTGFEPVYGGNYEEAEDIEVGDISIVSCKVKYEKDTGLFEISAQFELEGNMNIIEYISRKANYDGNVDFYISGWITVNITIKYNDLDCEPDEAYEIINSEINYTKVEFENELE